MKLTEKELEKRSSKQRRGCFSKGYCRWWRIIDMMQDSIDPKRITELPDKDWKQISRRMIRTIQSLNASRGEE